MQRIKKELYSRYGVTRIGHFDCYVDHHHNQFCDINILVELEKPMGWRFFDLKLFIQRKLQIDIDIFTAGSLKPALKAEIMSKIQFV